MSAHVLPHGPVDRDVFADRIGDLARDRAQSLVAENIDRAVVGLKRVIGLQLLIGIPDRRVLVRGIFQLDNPEVQTIDDDDHIWAPVMFGLDDGELIDRKPVIGVWVLEVNNFDVAIGQTRNLAFLFSVPSPTGS